MKLRAIDLRRNPIEGIKRGMSNGLIRRILSGAEGTNLADQFFREMDKLVGTIRRVPNLFLDQSGSFVEYQNIAAVDVVKKLILNDWRVQDINGMSNLLMNQDGWRVEVEDVPSGMVRITRIRLLNNSQPTDYAQLPATASPIGEVKHGDFHKWLGKSEDEPITDADIEKGLKAGGHAAKMANFARNARKWNHK